MFQLRKDEATALRSQNATSAFVELRRVASSYAEIEQRLGQIEQGWASTMNSLSRSSAPSVG